MWEVCWTATRSFVYLTKLYRRPGSDATLPVVLSTEAQEDDMTNHAMIYLAAALMAVFPTYSAPRVHSTTASGTLRGTVTDPSGAVIPGALVVASSGDFVRSVSTDETGQYAIYGLAAGHYRVNIHSAGFAAFHKSGLVVSSGYETESDAQLNIGASKQEITVSDR
jgi:protocatechuate 3,4-dioxygenase beta subunit